MAVLNALRETPDALLRNPVVVVPVFVLSVLQVPQLVLQSISPLLSSLVSLVVSLLMIVAVPFFQGGLVGMSAEALEGRTSLGTFLEVGKSKYVSLLGAYLLVFAFNLLLGIAVVVPLVLGGAYVGGLGLSGAGIGRAGLVVLAVVGLVAVAVLLAYLLVMFFLQFYGHAIVLEDLGAVAGLKRSASRVRQNLLSTLGYTIVVGVLGGVAGLVFGAGSWLTSPQTASLLGLPSPSLPIVVLIALTITALSTVFGAFLAIYSVAFYLRLVPAETPSA
jgi:hypothetical protein